MSNPEVPLTPEQKLLHAIFAPSDDAQEKADKTDFVFDQVRQRLLASRPDMPPFVNRIEACGTIRACFDRMWQHVTHDLDHLFDPVNFEPDFFNEVINDHRLGGRRVSHAGRSGFQPLDVGELKTP